MIVIEGKVIKVFKQININKSKSFGQQTAFTVRACCLINSQAAQCLHDEKIKMIII